MTGEKRRRAKRGAPAAFLSDILLRKEEIKGCVFWPYAIDANGYAQIRIGGKIIYVHRLVCAEVNGQPDSSDQVAAHNCGLGSSGCISPYCVEWKTHTENAADRIAHGNNASGERHGQAKLTADDVVKIKKLRSGGQTLRRIAETFGVTTSTVGLIISGENWSSVPSYEGA